MSRCVVGLFAVAVLSLFPARTVAVDVRAAGGGGAGVDPLELGAWEALDPVPLGRLEVQGASANDKLYVFGGYVSWVPFCTTAAAHAYDPAARLWSKLPDMPAPWTHAGVAVDGTDIYLAGGYENAPNCAPGEVATTAVYAFDTLARTWSSLPPLPEPRGSGALVRVGRTLHFFGGATTGRSEPGQGEHWVLSLDNTTPDDTTLDNTALDDAASDNTTFANTTFANITSGKITSDSTTPHGAGAWAERAPLPNPRSHLGAAVAGGKIYAVGGQHFANEGAVHQKALHVYDPERDVWETRAELPFAVSHATSSTLVVEGAESKILVVGGEKAHNDHLDTVLVYTPRTDTWTQLAPLPIKANAGVAGLIGQDLFFANGGEFSAETYRAPLIW